MPTRNMACIFTTMGKTGSNWLKPSNLVFRFSKASSFSALGRLCLTDCGRQELVVLAATPMAIFDDLGFALYSPGDMVEGVSVYRKGYYDKLESSSRHRRFPV